MRELKYRAWVKPQNKFVYFDIRELMMARVDYSSYLINNLEDVDRYTGLHDRKGVEIYEGDIVRIASASISFDSPIIGLVVWKPLTTGYVIQAGNPFFPGRKTERKPFGARIEVIGNIYESIEILKGEK